MFEQTTHDIKVEVHPSYVAEQSDPKRSIYFFSYQVKIQNLSPRPVQLIARHWIITDGFGRVEEVEGPGVVGLQPKLKPGEVFEYSSFCPLQTPTGSMRGLYMMSGPGGENFEVHIPLFILSEPNHYH